VPRQSFRMPTTPSVNVSLASRIYCLPRLQTRCILPTPCMAPVNPWCPSAWVRCKTWKNCISTCHHQLLTSPTVPCWVLQLPALLPTPSPAAHVPAETPIAARRQAVDNFYVTIIELQIEMEINLFCHIAGTILAVPPAVSWYEHAIIILW
jgi:hypothetical protein